MRPSYGSLKRRSRGGSILVWAVITIPALLAFVGLVTDTSHVLLTGHQLQNCADAAAIAAASNISSGTSVAAQCAVTVGQKNTAAGAPVQISAGSDIVFGSYSRTTKTFSAGVTPTNAVQVTCRRTSGSAGGPLGLFFGPLVGISSSNVSRQSIAMTDDLAAGVIILEPTADSSLTLGNNVNVNNGSVLINSTSSHCVGWSGHPTVTCKSLHTCGDCTNVASSGVCTGTCKGNCPTVTDPCSSLPPCSKGATQPTNKGGLHQPGYYPNGLPSGTCLPGDYYVDNGITLGNGDNLDCTAGCHIYLHTGGCSMTGTCSFSCNPPSSGTYKGICVHQDRGNSSPCTFHQGGSSTPTCKGTIYCPSSAVTCTGGTHDCACDQIICKTLNCQGQLDVTCAGSSSVSQHQAYLCN